MKAFLKEMFKEKSSVSSLRVMSIIALITACLVAFAGLTIFPVDYSGIAILCGTFLSAAFGGKVMQKHAEIKGEASGNSIHKE